MGDIVMEPAALLPLPPPNNIVAGEFTVLIGMGADPVAPNARIARRSFFVTPFNPHHFARRAPAPGRFDSGGQNKPRIG